MVACPETKMSSILAHRERSQSQDANDFDLLASTLMTSVAFEEWERFRFIFPQLQRLWTTSSTNAITDDSNLRDASAPPPEPLRDLLAAACHNPRVPIDVVRSIVRLDPRAAVLPDDHHCRTALHVVVQRGDRTDLVQALVEAAPSCIRVRDVEGLRPLEVLTQKIIVKEERIRYLGKRRTVVLEQALDDNWESARLLVTAHAEAGRDSLEERRRRPSPEASFLHCCLQATDVPLSLIERAIRRYKHELAVPDDKGNLPLHRVASRLPADDADDLLADILANHPQGASAKDRCGRWPLDLARGAGRKWDSGISLLLDVFPGAIESVDFTRSSIPLVMREFQRRQRSSLVYMLLRLHPDAVVTRRST